MRKEEFAEVFGDISEKHIAEAGAEPRVNKPVWVKWGAVAACFAAIILLGVGIFQSGLLGNGADIATLENGAEIVYHNSRFFASSIDIGVSVTTRQLTEDEIAILFPNLPVTAYAVFGDSELIGFEGNIGNVKMVISTTDIQLLDTEIVGTREPSMVNGTSVIAKYFETDRNSTGERNIIYCATFRLGDSVIYVENAGAKAEREAVKNELSAIIQALIDHGTLNLGAIKG